VEEPDLYDFDGEVGEEDESGALELLVFGGNFMLWVVMLASRPNHHEFARAPLGLRYADRVRSARD
jgi:hypothetical protein